MSRKMLLAVCCVILSTPQTHAWGFWTPSRSGGIELFKSTDDVALSIWSMKKPADAAPHTYVITHGLSGIEERFFKLAKAILVMEPGANVLVIEWDPAKTERLGAYGNPWAAAKRIDPTGDALAAGLANLHRKKVLDPCKTTFIGESFGNYVNHRAAVALAKTGCGKAYAALALNPASELGGYAPPLLTEAYAHSVVFVSDSLFDTRKPIAARTVQLKTSSEDPFVQHTFGLEWLQARVVAGERLDTLLEPRAELAASQPK